MRISLSKPIRISGEGPHASFLTARALLESDKEKSLIVHFAQVGSSAVGAAEDRFHPVDALSVAPFVDFTPAVGADVEAGLDRDGDEM